MDLNFLVEVVMHLYDAAPLSPTRSPDQVLKEIERVLGTINENCPGVSRVCYLLGKAKYLSDDIRAAELLLRTCISKNSGVAEAHLLMAQIHVQNQDLEEAAKCLDVGLSFNFKVRDHPLYFLTKARLMKRTKQVEQSVALLKSALDLPVFAADRKGSEKTDISESDKIAVYLELIDSLQLLGRTSEADALMGNALEMYSGKAEQQQLVLVNAQLRLQRGDVDGAFNILQTVTPGKRTKTCIREASLADQPNYQAARMKMAQIYLEEKHDKHKFAACYRDILEKDPSPQAYVLLGDAYMSIQEPTNAIEAYETAMRRNPKDHALAEKIGNAYVQCHLYHKAINFYEAAMKSGRQNVLRLNFADQLFLMGNYEKCERVLREVLDEESEPSDVSAIKDHVQYWLLLSKVHFENGNWQEAANDLQKAKALQMKILNKSGADANINMMDERKIASKICCQLAELHSNRREWNKAIDLYREAISINETDVKSMLALASIFMSMGKLQQCSQMCASVIAIDKNNNEATLMTADLMYQRNEGEQAIKHFSQLLDRNPNHYHALARYIELAWRKGELDQVEKYLKNAVENNPRATVDAGYNYCKGLVEWYTGDPNAALQCFNRSRRDLEWGERAIYNMIEICLNPDNEIIGGEVFDHSSDNPYAPVSEAINMPLNLAMVTQSEKWQPKQQNVSLRYASLVHSTMSFKELRHKPGLDYKYKLMENFIMLSSSNKLNVQQALNNFLELIGSDGSLVCTFIHVSNVICLRFQEGDKNLNVGAILGSARAYMLLKQTPKAKAQLKRVVAYPWSLEDADYLQQCWLLLADLYINQGKSDQATAILRTVLQHNASAIKAYEYMGFLREREQKFADAAANYEGAWRLCRQRNPAIGYKLAYNYLKCRKLFDCIEVCHIILRQFPNYPKIKKEILDKARANIRI
ncbi:tetratricopeptide repeat protein 21A isoform X1 [Aphelenchoides avenae]|nr:tetratricopeptide repeat protein 21A isoform X1 [Aphelenchus avenae]